MNSLPNLYLRSLLAARRRFDRSTRFEGWKSGPEAVRLERADYRAYAANLGLGDDGLLLPSWFYVLAQRPMLAMLADRRFPYPATGIVHLGNRAELHAQPAWESELTLVLEVRYGDLTSAGHRVEMTASYEQNGALVATNSMAAMVRCPDPDRKRSGSRSTQREPLAQALPIDYAADAGRRYARVSGDYNPIHLWPLTAKLFGFPRPIAHGMYSLGRIAALLLGQGIGVGRLLDVSFRKPAFLPSTARLEYEVDGSEARFELVGDQGQVLLQGAAR